MPLLVWRPSGYLAHCSFEEPLFKLSRVNHLLRGRSAYELFELFPNLRRGRLGDAVSVCRRIFPNATEKWVDRIAPTTFAPRNVEQGAFEGNEAFDPDYLKIKAGTRLVGYFQSAKYFAEEEHRVRKWYSVDGTLANKAAAVFRSAGVDPLFTAAVHVRLGDYRTQSHIIAHPEEGCVIPRDYYPRAFARLPKGVAVAVFSDEPDCAEEYIGRKADILGAGGDRNVEFAMISQCRFIVTGNSTFSWWAAWLARSGNKFVIGPKYFLGWRRHEWFPADIMVPGWEYI